MNKKPHIIFLSTNTINLDRKNYNFTQRYYFAKEYFNLHYFLRKPRYIEENLRAGAIIHQTPSKNRFFYMLYLIWYVAKYRKKYNFKAIIIEPSSLNIVGLIFKVLFNINWIIDIWDIPFRDLRKSYLSRLKRRIQILLFRPLFKLADLYIVSIIPDFQLKELNLQTSKIRAYKNAIFLDDNNNQRQNLGYYDIFTIIIQRSEFHKGFGLELMLDAFKIILKKIDAQLVVIGEVKQDVQISLNKFKPKNKIVQTGFLPHQEYIEITLKSHVCVIPFPNTIDLEQTYPIKAIEFMALGKAIVTSNLEGLRRLIDGAGVLINQITPENLANAIIDLHDHPEKRRALEMKAKERANLFDAKTKNESIFKEIIALL